MIDLFSSLQVIFNFCILNFSTSSKILLILSLWVSNSFLKFNDLCEMINSLIFITFLHMLQQTVSFLVFELFSSSCFIMMSVFELISLISSFFFWFDIPNLFSSNFLFLFSFLLFHFSWPFVLWVPSCFWPSQISYHMFWFFSCLHCLCLRS